MFVCTWFQGRPVDTGEWIVQLIFEEDYPLSGVINCFSSSSPFWGSSRFPLCNLACQLVLSLNKSYCWNFMGMASLSFPGDAISQKLFWSSGSSNPCSLFFMMCRRGCVIDVPTEVGYPSYLFSAFWLIVAFCNGLCLLQKRTSLVSTETYTYIWVLYISA